MCGMWLGLKYVISGKSVILSLRRILRAACMRSWRDDCAGAREIPFGFAQGRLSPAELRRVFGMTSNGRWFNRAIRCQHCLTVPGESVLILELVFFISAAQE